jgi:DNA-binding transcriptional MerR regulator
MSTAVHYPIRAVARMTGLSLDTLRAWERRYQAVTPLRGDRGRLYDDRDVARLKQLARLVGDGHAIGSIAQLPPAALARLQQRAAAAAVAPPPAVDLEPLMRALRQYDVTVVESTLSRHATLLPPPQLILSVILPMMRDTGARWQAGTVRPAQEHLVSAAVRSVLGGLLRTMAAGRRREPMVFATLPGERHELGLLSAAVLAAHAGRHVTYLGGDVPAADLVHAVNTMQASTLVVAATMNNATSVREVRALRRLRSEAAVWAGGPDRARVRRELGTRARMIETLEEFAGLLGRAEP